MEATSSIKSFKCELCEKSFGWKGNLIRHIKCIHEKIKDIHCPNCNYTCSEKGNLTRHIKHIHKKNKDIHCPNCDYTCSQKSTLTAHIKAVHDKIKDIHCPNCDFTCSEKSTLTAHIKAVHDKIKDIQCPKCDYTCFLKSNLTRHIKYIHDKIKDINCPKCDYTCSQKSTLTKHLKICTGKINMSSMEFKMKQALDEMKIQYSYDQTHDNLKGSAGYLRFDFIIPTPNESFMMIEMNGIQHYQPKCFGGISEERAQENYERQIAHDVIKQRYCEDNGYPLLIVKWDEDRPYIDVLREFLDENNYL